MEQLNPLWRVQLFHTGDGPGAVFSDHTGDVAVYIDYNGYLHVIGHADMLTGTAAAVEEITRVHHSSSSLELVTRVHHSSSSLEIITRACHSRLSLELVTRVCRRDERVLRIATATQPSRWILWGGRLHRVPPRHRSRGHAHRSTGTAATVDASSDHHPMIGAGPEAPARGRQIR
jgi:hypothetical protein